MTTHEVTLPQDAEHILEPSLGEFIENNPQFDEKYDLQYLLACGKAIQLVTHTQRAGSDIDVISFNPTYSFQGRVDSRTSTNCWGDTSYSASFLKETSYTCYYTENTREQQIDIVHPGILLVQKALAIANPYVSVRSKDYFDIHALYSYFAKELRENSFSEIIFTALDGVPYEHRGNVKAIVDSLVR